MDSLVSLPAGTRLNGFEIRSVLCARGKSVVYRAYDPVLLRDVVIKEHRPSFGGAQPQRTTDVQRAGMERIKHEARILSFLSQFRNSSLCGVLQTFEANDTAYLVLPYYPGETLHAKLLRGYRVDDEKGLFSILFPILRGLVTIHAAAYCHLDISPDNIILSDKGELVLIDFDAARYVPPRYVPPNGSIKSCTIPVKDGYSPIEQYYSELGIGPWSDIYALSALAYQLVTGEIPVVSVARMRFDECTSLANYATPSLSAEILDVIRAGLTVMPRGRPRDATTFARMLLNASKKEEEAVRAGPAPANRYDSARSALADWAKKLAVYANLRSFKRPASVVEAR